MKIMLIEDDNRKRQAIKAHLRGKGISMEDVIDVKNMTDFAANLNADVGLFIIDFKLPSIDGVAASQNGKAILQSIVKAGKNNALLVAISSYPDDFSDLRAEYEAHGCILADYANKRGWKSTLDHLLIQLKKDIRFDFIIFCALHEERNPYVVLFQGRQVIRGGIDCYDIEIGGKRGSVILLPQMGLVNVAVTAGVCIDRFRPCVVGMSGICGGFKERSHMGQLLVSSMAYEYQSGKWASDGFKHEPYQVPADHVMLTELKAMVNVEDFICILEDGFQGMKPQDTYKPGIGIFTSGSAVIADQNFINQIQTIHRKVNALDMEVFAIHRAAELSPLKPPCICAKTVVDLCDTDKADHLHSYGCYISAKFLVKAIEKHFLRK